QGHPAPNGAGTRQALGGRHLSHPHGGWRSVGDGGVRHPSRASVRSPGRLRHVPGQEGRSHQGGTGAMTTETRKLRVGLDSPLVADHWSRPASAILDVNEADINRESDRRWRWRLADVEKGTVEFMDSTPGNTELRLELERED